jgi:glycosyltransferase involved in cell wall biosynthesis
LARIIIFEPYYGGSHRAFVDGLVKLPCEFQVHTLPANRWKWRMRLAAPFFAGRIRRGEIDLTGAAAILCSSILDVAAFKAMLPLTHQHLPILVYFHENQFAYPVQEADPRDIHFALTNLTTALTADRLAFNSAYNLESFLDGCRELLAKNDDMELTSYEESIRAKSRILQPGLDIDEIDRHADRRGPANPVPVIVWNHRWEHDKDPEIFFTTLFALKEKGVEFQLIVMGESFRQRPKVFEQARVILADRIIHMGYAQSRAEYLAWLAKADIVVSTARHEFFGLSVLEAVRAGCWPLLPRRLVYPELFGEEFLYDDQEFETSLRFILTNNKRLTRLQARELTGPFSWRNLTQLYEEWLTL